MNQYVGKRPLLPPRSGSLRVAPVTTRNMAISDRFALRIVLILLTCLIAGQVAGAAGCGLKSDPVRERDPNQEPHYER